MGNEPLGQEMYIIIYTFLGNLKVGEVASNYRDHQS